MAKTIKYRAGIEVWIPALTCAVLGFWLSRDASKEIFAASFHRVLQTGTLAASVAVSTVIAGIGLGCFFLYIAITLLIARRSHKGVLKSVNFSKTRAILNVDGTDIRIAMNERLRSILEDPEIIGGKVSLRLGGPVVLLLEIEWNS